MGKSLGQDTPVVKQSTTLDPAKVANLGTELEFSFGTHEFKALGVRKMVKLIAEGFNVLQILSDLSEINDEDMADALVRVIQDDELFDLIKKFIYASIDGVQGDPIGDDIQFVDLLAVVAGCRAVYDVASIKRNFTAAGFQTPQLLLNFLDQTSESQKD